MGNCGSDGAIVLTAASPDGSMSLARSTRMLGDSNSWKETEGVNPWKVRPPRSSKTARSCAGSCRARRTSSRCSSAATRPGSSRTSRAWWACGRTRSTSPRRSSSRCSRLSTGSTPPTSSRPGSSGSPETRPSTTCASGVPGPSPSRFRTRKGGPARFPRSSARPGLDPYGRLRNVERGEAILRAIEELPEDFRELIALRHFAGLSYEEIATVKDMPLGTVKNKLFRARAVLKDRLSGEVT